ncbi:arginine--tRNA ligase [Candidatus Micrarchaeota archaeon]|nr:arginine--tRNA ligase [Candidatus Micrarchaeota archaeon]
MIANAKHQLSKLISLATGEPTELCLKTLEVAEEGKGDIASKISFIASKKMKMSPVQAAQEIAAKLESHEWVKKAEPTGPYINFFLSDSFFSEVCTKILNEGKAYGRGGNNRRVIVESPAVNPNKPWHIGHLRNALLGNSVANILEFGGDEVQRLDYIDDLGLQVAQSLWGYLNSEGKIEGKADHWMGAEYVKVASKMEQDAIVKKEAEGILKQMESGSGDVAEQARKLTEECVRAQYETASNYGVSHDALICESDILREVFKEGMQKLKDNNAVHHETSGKNEGCWVVKLGGKMSGMEDPDKILIRSNGTATYTGKDMVFQLWKFGKLNGEFNYEKFLSNPNGKSIYITSKEGKRKDGFGKAELVINVIGVEQKYPQEVIAHVMGLLGFEEEAKNSIHLSYEHAWLPEAKFSGRKGTWLGHTADELLEEGQKRALEKVKGDFEDDEKKEIAKTVSAGAIRYAFLKIAPEKKLIFKWDEVLSLEGDSGPYLQYACVRARRIMEKANFEPSPQPHAFNDDEKRLLKELGRFPEVVQDASRKMRPHIIADYIYNLSNVFSRFYTNSRVLNAETQEERKTRLAMVVAFEKVLSSGLGLLGVPIPNRM